MAVGPPGKITVRNMAVSSSERASMFCIHAGMAARAASTPALTARTMMEVLTIALRDNFNLHLLGADVVRHVLRGYSQSILTGRQLLRHGDSPCAGARVRIPAQAHRRCAF